MNIKENYNLSELNTFGVKTKAKFFIEIEKEQDLLDLFLLPEFKQNKKIFLGGGSNVLFTTDFDGFVVLNKLKGMEILKEDTDNVLIRAMGGEIWHDFVMFTVNKGYWGIENLALIPGTVGATPIQNIGAYGVEIKDTLLNLEAFEINTGIKKVFNKAECRLAYRDSIFKNELKGKYFISAITLSLSKKEKKNISYRSLSSYLEENKIEVKQPKDISDVVMLKRRSIFPDPKILGNAGSFFKNVFIETDQLKKLQETFPDIAHFDDDGVIKIPAGWLIEQAGWKGKRIGNVGVHEKHALILVNYGGATGSEIIELANKIIASVKEKFGLILVPEVNIV